MTTCDNCERPFNIDDLTDHHGVWHCAECDEELGLNETECEICQEKCPQDQIAGCCSDGACPHNIENVCTKCGTWDKEKEIWRCPSCEKDQDQYKQLCSNGCGTMLTENVGIHCLRKSDDEETYCSECRDVNWAEMKAEGWICCDGDCDSDCDD